MWMIIILQWSVNWQKNIHWSDYCWQNHSLIESQHRSRPFNSSNTCWYLCSSYLFSSISISVTHCINASMLTWWLSFIESLRLWPSLHVERFLLYPLIILKVSLKPSSDLFSEEKRDPVYYLVFMCIILLHFLYQSCKLSPHPLHCRHIRASTVAQR